jgi:FkbM family methyltransferase
MTYGADLCFILLQVDVEGFETQVLESGSEMLRSRTHNVLLEYSPGMI